MRVSVDDIRRIELIPETEEEKRVCQDILDKKAIIYWGDAGENFDPPEMLGGLILNSYGAVASENVTYAVEGGVPS